MRAYDLANGDERWVFRANDATDARQVVGGGSLTSPVVVGDTVLFGVAVRAPVPGSGGNVDGLYAVDTATGEVRWRTSTATPIRSAPAVLDGTVYAMGGSTNTVLHLLAAAYEGEIPFTMQDIDRLSRRVPVLCKVAPAKNDVHVEDVHRAGGIMAILG